jgi:hypothetical protein
VHKVQHKPIKYSSQGLNWNGAKGLECVVNWRTGLSGAPGPYKGQPATLGKMQARSAIIHWTVWCATGLFGEPVGNDYLRATVDCKSTCHVNSVAAEVRGHRTVQCRKRTKLQRSSELQTLTVRWRGGAPNSAQYLSGGVPDCPVRSSLAASPTATLVVGGYKYPPTTTTSSIQVFWRSH